MSADPSKVPPFRRIANELRAEILRGDLSPGDKIPSQEQLEQRFGASRATVRKGVAVLATEGLVTTSQGKASIVRERPNVSLRQTGSIYRARRATGEVNFNAEARAQGQRVHQEIREVAEAPAPEAIAERFRLAPGAPMVVRRLLFVADGKDGAGDTPLQLCDGYYDATVARGTRLADARLIKGAPTPLLRTRKAPSGVASRSSSKTSTSECPTRTRSNSSTSPLVCLLPAWFVPLTTLLGMCSKSSTPSSPVTGMSSGT